MAGRHVERKQDVDPEKAWDDSGFEIAYTIIMMIIVEYCLFSPPSC